MGGSAPKIEIEGAKRLLNELQEQGVNVASCITDCNMTLSKVLRERHIEVHYDLHHVSKIVRSFG